MTSSKPKEGLEAIGHYRLAGHLGGGGMGVVYRARDERLDRWVAIKLLRPDREIGLRQRERFRREARASARLKHPHIVQVYDILEVDGTDCIVMELAEGEPLSRTLQHGPLEAGPALVLAQEVADALTEAHAQGIVHRDLKTENVIVLPGGHAKVVDFGIAKWLREDSEASLTATGTVLGTCRAMAPEQARGLAVDARADLFSLGILLYEMLTGVSPFLGPNDLATLQRVCHHRQQPAREVNIGIPQDLSDLIEHLLQKDPSRRPRSAREVASALDRIAAGQPLRQEGRFASLPPLSDTAEAATLEATLRLGSSWTLAPERRQVTVLRCALVGAGSAPDSEISAFQDLAAEVVQRFEGRVGAASGPWLLAWFGYAPAHEDDPQRAVRAALELTRAMAGRPHLVVAGIHSGTTIVTRGDGAAEDLVPLGELQDFAADLQRLAGEGVLISEAAYRLVQGFFECEALAPVLLPGAPDPARIYRVLADRRVHSRIESAEEETLTPFVGRALELDLLRDRWGLAREGRGQVILLYGDAGIGKSRLLRELRTAVAPEEGDWIECHASAYHSNSALHPFIELLGRALGDAPPATRLGRLEDLLGRSGLAAAEAVPLLAPLLSLPIGDRYAPRHLAPLDLRKQVLETLLALLMERAERRPLLMVVEDLHWIDPTSLDLLGLLIAQAPALPLLLVLSSRPEQQSSWGQGPLTRIHLAPLSRTQAGTMIDGLAGAQGLPADVRLQVLERTDGHPLFVEEVTRMVLESGLTSASAASIPATLEGWLLSRIDRLGTAKEVAQWAAAIGREFSYELLRVVLPFDDAFLERELDRLVQADLLYRRGTPQRTRYVFKHALLQDSAYASLVLGARQMCHQSIADALEVHFPEIAERQPEVVAHHLTEAGLAERAVPFWRRAGDRALKAAANHEAAEHFSRGLALLATLPGSPGRDRQEIAFQVAFGIAEGQARGYAKARPQEAFARAWELCRSAGTTPELFPVLRGLFVSSIMGGNPDRALEIANQLLEIAGQDPLLQLTGHQSIGHACMLIGRFPESQRHLEKVLELCGPDRSLPDAHLPGSGDPVVEALCGLCMTEWFLGRPDRALQHGREALDLARRRSYPFTLVAALHFLSTLQVLRRETADLAEHSRLLLGIAEEKGVSLARGSGLLLSGCSVAGQGRAEEGLELIGRGVEAIRSTGLSMLPMALLFLAEGCRRLGKPEEGLAALDEADAQAAAGGQRYIVAEALRLRAELLRLQGAPHAEVEDRLRGALEHARGQSARSLELRSAISLARALSAEARRNEARDLLAAVYNGFTEGFQTGDLLEAKQLLEELA